MFEDMHGKNQIDRSVELVRLRVGEVWPMANSAGGC